jgi:hypothetical protein
MVQAPGVIVRNIFSLRGRNRLERFVPGKLLHARLIFESKSGAYP